MAHQLYNYIDKDFYGLADNLIVKNFNKEEAKQILIDNYINIYNYVNSNPNIPDEVTFIYLPAFRRVYQDMLERLSTHERRNEITLKSYTEFLCDHVYIIEQINDNFKPIYDSISKLNIDSQAETLRLITSSISSRNHDLIRNHFDTIVRHHKMNLLD